MKIVVTGGGGFLGFAIVKSLLQHNYQVVSVARNHYPELQRLGVTQVRGSLVDPDTSLTAFKNCNAVIHCAAKAGIWGRPDDFYQANVVATQNVVDACRKLSIPKLIFTSSPSVTFAGNDECNASQDLPYPPTFLADYPRTKALAEQIVLSANDDALATVALRPHLIWGVGDPHLIPRLLQRHQQGRLKIVGSGTNIVDMTHVDNAAHAHTLALEQLNDNNLHITGRPYFISDDNPVNMWDWLNQLFLDLGYNPLKSRVSARFAFIAGSLAETLWRLTRRSSDPPMTRFVAKQLSTSHYYDMTPAKTDLGYTPIVNPNDAYHQLLHSLRQADPQK